MTLQEIQVTPANPTLPAGLDQQFQATGIYSDGSNRDITADVSWQSTDTLVADHTTNGLFTSRTPGAVTVSASLGGLSSDATGSSATLTVTTAELVSIAVTPTNPSTPLGVDVGFTAMGTYTDASIQDISTQVTWDSSAPGVATVSNTSGSEGSASPMTTGNTVISASLSGISSSDSLQSSTLTVTAAVLVSIAVTPVDPSTPLGVDVQFTATGTYSDASQQDISTQATWSSAIPATAQISNSSGSEGLAGTVATGSTAISASLGGINSPNSTLTVTNAELVSIAVTPVDPSTPLGVDVNFTATGTYTDATTQNITTQVTWTSFDPAVASISNAGGSEGLASVSTTGSTAISAGLGGISSDDSAESSTLTVTAAELVSIAVTPASASISEGQTQQFVATGTYTDSTTQVLTSSVSWASQDNAIATVDNASNKGLATGVSQGTVAIDATDVATSISASQSGGEASLTVTPVYTSCADILTNSPGSTDGVYLIDPDGAGGVAAFSVYCDMTTEGGGWTVIAMSYTNTAGDTSLPFNVNWSTFVNNGVGSMTDLANNFFIPLVRYQAMASVGKQVEYVWYAKASSAADPWQKTYGMTGHYLEGTTYILRGTTSYELAPGQSLSYSIGRPLTTSDVDNDVAGVNCATTMGSPFWYGACFQSHYWANYNSHYGPYATDSLSPWHQLKIMIR